MWQCVGPMIAAAGDIFQNNHVNDKPEKQTADVVIPFLFFALFLRENVFRTLAAFLIVKQRYCANELEKSLTVN